MENYSNEAYTPYGGYRAATTAEPHEAPYNFQASSPESYYPPTAGRYQQQEQQSESQQPYFAPQAGYNSPFEKNSITSGARTAGWLSYLGGWVTGLLFFLLKRDNHFVRFHAIQSLLFFGGMSIVTAAFHAIPLLNSISAGLGFVTFICWIILMVKAAHGTYYKLPIIGEYAEKWANEWKG
ncbi:MAG TPA: DUF4870 domain-containing protein [Ktedonobacteraceae bacterium]